MLSHKLIIACGYNRISVNKVLHSNSSLLLVWCQLDAFVLEYFLGLDQIELASLLTVEAYLVVSRLESTVTLLSGAHHYLTLSSLFCSTLCGRNQHALTMPNGTSVCIPGDC